MSNIITNSLKSLAAATAQASTRLGATNSTIANLAITSV